MSRENVELGGLQLPNHRDVGTSPIFNSSSQTTLQVEVSFRNFKCQGWCLTSSGLCWVFNAATAVSARKVLGSNRQQLVSVVWILFVLKDYANKVDTSESQGRDRMPVQLDSCSAQGLPHVPEQSNGMTEMIEVTTNHVL